MWMDLVLSARTKALNVEGVKEKEPREIVFNTWVEAAPVAAKRAA